MSEIEHLSKWIAALMEGLEAEVDEETRERLMEYCGHACAFHFGSLYKAKAIQSEVTDIDELLNEINQQENFWCGKWVRDGEIIYSVCEACGCPLVRAGLVELSSTFCQCSRGWVKAVFETLLGKAIEVNLEQAIGREDKICKYIVSERS